MNANNLLNLTLDEIIQSKRGLRKNQSFDLSRRQRMGPIGRNQAKNLKSTISSSLSSRLSLGRKEGGTGFNKANGDIQKSFTLQNRRRQSSDRQRISVHNRLTMTKNPYSQPFRAPFTLATNSLQRKRNLKTKSYEDSQPVRITNGAVVKGLRSDQLLLQKLNQHRNRNLQSKIEKLRTLQTKRAQLLEPRRERRLSPSSSVSLNFNRGLTVSIANEVARKTRALRVRRPPPPPSPSSSSSYSSEDDDSFQRQNRRVAAEPKEPPVHPALLRLGLERPPPPKPHRPVLDPQIQREISALQGFAEPHSGGPGPGVKGFKMIPSRTRHSLHERFTMEKSVIN